MSNEDVVARYLRRRFNLTPAQTAGVIGGLKGESGSALSTTAKNPSSGAYGIAQWLGGRKSKLFARGNPSSLKTQLQHLGDELEGPERGALNAIKGARNIDQATELFVRKFERPSEGEIQSSIGARKDMAREFFRKTGGRIPNGGGSIDAGGGGRSNTGSTTSVTVGAGAETVEDPEAKKRVVLANLLQQTDPGSLLLKLGIVNPNEPTTKTVDSPGTTITKTTGGGGRSSGRSAGVVSGAGGRAKITGPNPGRIKPEVKNFMGAISSVRGGKPVVGSDGTGHSKYTVNGKVSEHSTGNASDIPARGQELTNLGQAALIAAGMPRAQARKTKGGLFNLHKGGKRYQIIFNTTKGGNHYDHLHVGVSGR